MNNKKTKVINLIKRVLVITAAIALFSTAIILTRKNNQVEKIAEVEEESKKAELYGDFYYSVENEEIKLCSYLGTSTTVVIPSEIDGKPVTTIGKYFCNGKKITSVTIPNSVTVIEKEAFYACNLTSITIPNSVKTIGDDAFLGCGLTYLSLGNSIETIGDSAFYGNKLTSISIPNLVETIGDSAFYPCENLRNLTLGNSIKVIGKNAFSASSGVQSNYVTTLTIPDSVEVIGENAFYRYGELETLTLGSSLKTIEKSAFGQCKKLKNLNIPNSVEMIGDSAFSYCFKLENLTLGNSLKSIGKQAFDCSGYEVTYLTNIELPDTIENIAEKAFSGKLEIESITLPKNIKTIGDKAIKISYSGTFYCYRNSGGLSYAKKVKENTTYNNFHIVILDPVTSISIKELPTKRTYIQNYEYLDLTGGSINAVCQDSSIETISMEDENISIAGFSNTTAGTKTITVKYEEQITTFNVTVVAKTVTQLEIIDQPIKTTYVQNCENLDLTGGKLQATYNEEYTEYIDMTSNNVTKTGFNNSALGPNVVKLTYGDKSVNVLVEIIENCLQSIEISTEPTKKVYVQNRESLDLTGGKIKLIYDAGNPEYKDMTAEGVTTSGFDRTTTGIQEITVSYSGKELSYYVRVNEEVLTNIEVKTQPTKKEYKQDMEDLNLTGGIIEVTYNNTVKETKDMTASGVTVSGFDNSKIGEQTITVSYGEKTDTFNVTIIGKNIIGILMKEKPNTEYFKDEEINLTNGVITVTYEDNTTEDINMTSSGITLSGFNNTTLGEQEITATYKEKTVTFNVMVGILGDINFDGKIDITDTLKLKRHLVATMLGETEGEWILPEKVRYLGDKDKNGILDITDIYQIKMNLLESL